MSKKIGIILVNYQDYAQRFLPACRDSLRAQDYPAELRNFYIIDNASGRESEGYLKNIFPEARILTRPDGNYAAANNLGFFRAIEDGCEYLVTVNMDTEMAPDWLTELSRALDDNPEAGIAQAKVLFYPQTEEEKKQPRINSLGNIINFLGFGFTSGAGEPDREISGLPEIKGYASGCSFIIRSEIFHLVGGYNEEYYMYHDDLELSLKVRLTGKKIILAPRSVIYHKYEFSRSIQMLYYMERNRYLTILSFYPAYLIFLVGLPGMIMDIGLLFYSLLNGWFGTEMKIYGYFSRYSTYVKIGETRQRLKKLAQVRFSALAKGFSGRIDHQEVGNPLLEYLVNPLFNFYWQLVKKII